MSRGKGLLWLLAVLALPVHAQTTVEYIHTDALGSPVAVTDANGNVIERSEYEPFGKVLVPSTPGDGPGYTGHVFDSATGMNYMQQRYYDPGIGRFLSVDPVTADSGTGTNFNRYWYANNNPYTFDDPDGRRGRRITDGGSEDQPGQHTGAAYIGWSVFGMDVNSFAGLTQQGYFGGNSPGSGTVSVGQATKANDAKAATNDGISDAEWKEHRNQFASDLLNAIGSPAGILADLLNGDYSSAVVGVAVSRVPGAGAARAIFKTTKEAAEAAASLGFRRVKGVHSHGQAVFTDAKGKIFITPDVDSHKGGAWKVAYSLKDLLSGKRAGTFSSDLNTRIGD